MKDFIKTGGETKQLSKTSVQKPVRAAYSFAHIWNKGVIHDNPHTFTTHNHLLMHVCTTQLLHCNSWQWGQYIDHIWLIVGNAERESPLP